MKMAIAHDWLVTVGGAERVLEQMVQLYPEADLFSLIDFFSDEQRTVISGKHPQTTFLQQIPGARRHYRNLLPLMPYAAESLSVASYDLVLSSCYAVIKGLITGPDQLHICYCYSPMRYAWDLQEQYLAQAKLSRGLKSAITRAILLWIRMWDLRTAPGVDRFIAISHYIRRRIQKVYGRDATVIYPPVDVHYFESDGPERDDFYVTASRMVPYKKIDMIVEAFAGMPSRKLVVIGDGPEMPTVQRKCAPNIQLLGYQDRQSLRDHLRRARAFIFAAQEDFGIAPLEAQACGTPVIAFGRGGALETIVGLDNRYPTGVFFQEQTPECLRQAVEEFESQRFRISSDRCREHATSFAPERFRIELGTYIDQEWTTFRRNQLLGSQEVRFRSAAHQG